MLEPSSGWQQLEGLFYYYLSCVFCWHNVNSGLEEYVFSYFKLENFESCLQFYSQELDLNLLSVAGYSPFFFL